LQVNKDLSESDSASAELSEAEDLGEPGHGHTKPAFDSDWYPFSKEASILLQISFQQAIDLIMIHLKTGCGFAALELWTPYSFQKKVYTLRAQYYPVGKLPSESMLWTAYKGNCSSDSKDNRGLSLDGSCGGVMYFELFVLAFAFSILLISHFDIRSEHNHDNDVYHKIPSPNPLQCKRIEAAEYHYASKDEGKLRPSQSHWAWVDQQIAKLWGENRNETHASCQA
ncbi:hypothetical protein DFH28DRAFT_930613, partial [Melampsora americana]